MTDPGRRGGEGTGWPCDDYQAPLTCWTVPSGRKVLICQGCRERFPDGAEVQALYAKPSLDPVTARDTIDETLGEHFVMWHALDPGENGPHGEWRCMCGLKFGFSATAITHQRDSLLAALASQERGE